MSDELSEPTRPLPAQPVEATPIPPPAAPRPASAPAPYAQPFPASTGAYTPATRPVVGTGHIVFAWLMAVFTLGYFLPWAIAATRQRSNAAAIGVLNLFVGWTVIGWIAALVMACMSDPPQVTNVAYAVAPVMHVGQPALPPAGWYPQQSGGQRYWDGQRWTEHTAP